jgi:hypothetical protein
MFESSWVQTTSLGHTPSESQIWELCGAMLSIINSDIKQQQQQQQQQQNNFLMMWSHAIN